MRVAVWGILLAFAATCGCGPAPEQAGTWEPLFNGTDLTGWEIVGEGNWSARDGCIVVSRQEGGQSKGWLVTTREFADFRLRMKFKSSLEEFNGGVLFRDPGHAKIGRPAFSGFEFQLLQEAGGGGRNPTGAIYDLACSYDVRIEPDTWNDIEIRCLGDHISTFLNGEKTAEAHSRRSFEGAIGLQLHGRGTPVEFWWKDIEIMESPPAPAAGKLLEEWMEQAPGEFTGLLAGKTLEDDFQTYWDGGAGWTLNDEVLRGEHPDEISWIFTKQSYADFVLAFDYRLSKGGNAGVCVRLPWPADGDTSTGPASLGFECQIAGPDTANPTGSIYELARAYETDLWHKPIHRPGAWNHCRIYARKDHIATFINQRKTAEIHLDRSSSGRIGFQVHNPAKWVEYRNVRLKVIEGAGGTR